MIISDLTVTKLSYSYSSRAKALYGLRASCCGFNRRNAFCTRITLAKQWSAMPCDHRVVSGLKMYSLKGLTAS